MMLHAFSYDELLALHLLVMEAKFHPDPLNRALAGSHRVADLALQIVSALNEAVLRDEGPEGARPDWIAWQHFTPQHAEYGVVLARLREDRHWLAMPAEQQRRYCADMISPLVASDGLLDLMIQEAAG